MSEYEDILVAFDGESSDENRAVVGVNAGGTSIHASSSVWATDTGHYVDFLMRDKQDASCHSTASTFGHGDQAVEVSMHFPTEGVLRVVNGNEKWPSISEEDIAIIERLRQSVMLDNRYFKMLLSFGNWFKEGLIGQVKKLRRDKEEIKLFAYLLEGMEMSGELEEGCNLDSRSRLSSSRPKPRPRKKKGLASIDDMTLADWLRPKKAKEAATTREAYLQITGSLVIKDVGIFWVP
ncbi:PREDICTED: LOC110762176 [Prunus dulcis]|uniref:PREDICTED: LOC110762176 n=1 Tax=Prunus dulcis TaxID=3755 RepID=A0A5E4GMI5_PRUDU|nr:PREDICTED: LOC110762176 [Prunus dulcis]